MIYLFNELDALQEEHWKRALSLLSEERREYVLHFRQIEDQKRSAVGWLLLAYGLKQEYGIATPPAFSYTPSGKPYLSGKNMPFFNLSHSGTIVGCALHNAKIGLDVQKLVSPRPSLVRRVCTEKERTILEVSAAPDAEFCRFWSMKESAVKLTGEGITGNFSDILELHPDICTRSVFLRTNPANQWDYAFSSEISAASQKDSVLQNAVLSYSIYTHKTEKTDSSRELPDFPLIPVSLGQLL